MADNYKIYISKRANDDLAEHLSFVNRVSLNAAINLHSCIYSAINSLTMFPERNPIFNMPKAFPFITRKLVINGRYIAIYAIEQDTVVVYRILDARKNFESLVDK